MANCTKNPLGISSFGAPSYRVRKRRLPFRIWPQVKEFFNARPFKSIGYFHSHHLDPIIANDRNPSSVILGVL